jgi:type IV pilus assembly protein PilA
MASRRRATSAGFTLAELMVVVVIVGTLAVIAVVGIRQYMVAARANEAAAMIQSIRAAQEAHKAETNNYLDISTTMDSTWYPDSTPGRNRRSFHDTGHSHFNQWMLLNPTFPGEGVRWRYTTKAGPVDSPAPNASEFPRPSGAPAPISGANQPKDWYAIQAMGDTDGDGKAVYMSASSVTGRLFDYSRGD